MVSGNCFKALCVCICHRSSVKNQILKTGFTAREIVIMENDDPGGVFEFSPSSRGPWLINVSQTSDLPTKTNKLFRTFVCVGK